MGQNGMPIMKFYSGKQIPVELHKVRIVQKLHLKRIDDRYKAINEAGYNTFLLNINDIFLDMLTDSGTNAMHVHPPFPRQRGTSLRILHTSPIIEYRTLNTEYH
jgi:hypothetical protein